MSEEYYSAIRQLYALNLHGGMELGLKNAFALQRGLNYPDKSFPSIHVAGTNGKGSVATKISKALQLAGYRVGLYTSPHLSTFRERIQINGELISEKEAADLLSLVFDVAKRFAISATFFEVTTQLAFSYFAQKKVDIAVLEVGFGGRLDATNVVEPLVSVITSISLDHTSILGETVEAIAFEKAGIIKKGIPVIVGPRACQEVIKKLAAERGSPYVAAEDGAGSFDEENVATARLALEQLSAKWHLSAESIAEGLKMRPPCRMEEVPCGSTTVILDVAHNPDGFFRLFDGLAKRFENRKFRVVAGLSKDKDVAGCLEVLTREAKYVHFVQAEHPRAAPAGELQELVQGRDGRGSASASIKEGFQKALALAEAEGDVLVICGSFFIMADIREALGISEPRDPFSLHECLKPV